MRFTPKFELERRTEKLQVVMQKEGLDGAIILQNADLFYFAGTIQQSHLFIPAYGEPLLLVNKSLTRAQSESALANIIPFNNVKDIIAILGSFGYNSLQRIGFELDVLPTNLYQRYCNILQPVKIVDISSAIRSIRAVKSLYELERIRDAARMNHILLSRVREFLHEGISEIEFAGKLEAVFRREGHQCFIRTRAFNMETSYGHILSGTNLAVPSFLASPTGGSGLNPSFPQSAGFKKIERNESVMVDYVGVVDGYIVDQTRIFCLGQLSPKLVKAHSIALEIQEMLKNAAKPGVCCGDLFEMTLCKAKEYGLEAHFMGYPERAPFVGHGIGIELDEWPVIARGSKLCLEEGMVLAIEPKFVFPEGAVGTEDTFLVTPSGLENLTYFDEGIIYL